MSVRDGQLPPHLRQLLRAIGDELVYRSASGATLRQVRSGVNRRCDRAVRAFVDQGLVVGPPEGGSFYQLTDAAIPHLPGRPS